MTPPPEAASPLPLEGATPAARPGRFRGVRLVRIPAPGEETGMDMADGLLKQQAGVGPKAP